MRIIGGEFKRRRFEVPRNITARPTTDFARENLFNVLSNLMDFEDVVALDLFSGTGAVSFELISRGAARVTSVEKHRTQYQFQQKVARELKVEERYMGINGDAFRFLNSSSQQFDFIFADPPYDMPNFATVPELVLQGDLLKEGGVFVMEHSKKNDFSSLPFFQEKRVYGSVNFSIFYASDLESTEDESSTI